MDNLDRNRDRDHEFDARGRLRKGERRSCGSATSVTADWTQEYSYDRYGNKTGVGSSPGIDENTDPVPPDGLTSLAVSAYTNCVTTSGWTYDLSGNLVRGQNASAVWQRSEYDAAGRLKNVLNDSSAETETYTYGASRGRLITDNVAGDGSTMSEGQSVIAAYSETGSATSRNTRKAISMRGRDSDDVDQGHRCQG